MCERLLPPQHKQSLEAELTYTGDAHALLQTCLCVNVPVKGLATLPIELAVSNLCLNIKLRIGVLHDDSGDAELTLTATEQPLLSFDVTSEIGYKRTVSDLPRLRELLLTFALKALTDTLVAPKQITIHNSLLRTVITKLATSAGGPAATIVQQPATGSAGAVGNGGVGVAGSGGSGGGGVAIGSSGVQAALNRRLSVADKLGLGPAQRSAAAALGLDLKKHE